MADKIEKPEQHTPNPARPMQPSEPSPPKLMASLAEAGGVPEMDASKAPKAVAKGPPPAIDERLFSLAEFKQNHFYAIARAGHTLEDVLRAEYWAHVANNKLAPGNKIAVFWEDRSKYVELVVFEVGVNWAAVALALGPIRPAAAMAGKSVGTDFEIKNLGEIKKWGVIRRSDGREILADGSCDTQEKAARWLADYIRSTVGQRAA